MSADTIARRDEAILVIIDEQERLAVAMERREPVRSATVRLVRVATLVGVPIVVTRQYPQGLGDIEPELVEALAVAQSAGAQVTFVDKVTFDCFGEPAFAESVLRAGRRQLLVVGMETHICVAQTALAGLRDGFDVHVVSDACCARSGESHQVALERVGRAGAVVTVSESVMYELVGQAATEEFRALLAIVKG